MESLKGLKISKVEKGKLEKAKISQNGNLIVKIFDNKVGEWFFLLDENGGNISRAETLEIDSIASKEFAGNKDVLKFIVSKLPKE